MQSYSAFMVTLGDGDIRGYTESYGLNFGCHIVLSSYRGLSVETEGHTGHACGEESAKPITCRSLQLGTNLLAHHAPVPNTLPTCCYPHRL
jgi:hypothetical protein